MNYVEWETVCVFEIVEGRAEQRDGTDYIEDYNGLVAVINRNNQYVPCYSVQVGWESGDTGKLSKYIRPRFTGFSEVQVVLDDSIENAVALLRAAHEWIADDVNRIADQRQEEREARERAQADRGKPAARSTGKTDRKRGRDRAETEEQT